MKEILKLYPQYTKVYGPYKRKDNRLHICLTDGTKYNRKTLSYPKALLEIHIGRVLLDNETTDHIDNNFNNNDISNLQILIREDNSRKNIFPAVIGQYTCPECSTLFNKKAYEVRHNQYVQKKAGPFCSKKCAGKYSQRIQSRGRSPIGSRQRI